MVSQSFGKRCTYQDENTELDMKLPIKLIPELDSLYFDSIILLTASSVNRRAETTRWWGMQAGSRDWNASLFSCCLAVVLHAGWCCRGDSSGGNPCRLFELWRGGRRGSAGCFQERSVTRSLSFCQAWLSGGWIKDAVTPVPPSLVLCWPANITHLSTSALGGTLVEPLTAQTELLLSHTCAPCTDWLRYSL